MQALIASGAAPENATSVAEAVMATEASGVVSHGLAYVPTYCEHVAIGKVDGKAVPGLEATRPGMLVADAKTGFAQPAIAKGFERLVPLARQLGIAALAVRNSYNCGMLSFYTDRLAAEGLLGIGFTNAPASIAPANGRKAVVGTNPFAVAVPDGKGGSALSIDQSASIVAKSEIMKSARLGKPIPPEWAFGPDGQPTSDPALALKGTMAPAGGYKGVGVGLFVELMAAAASGATLGIDASPFSGPAGGAPRTGQFFIALDAQASSGGHFTERVARLSRAFLEQDGVRLPGAHRRAARKRLGESGELVVDAALYEKVLELGKGSAS